MQRFLTPCQRWMRASQFWTTQKDWMATQIKALQLQMSAGDINNDTLEELGNSISNTNLVANIGEEETNSKENPSLPFFDERIPIEEQQES